MRITIDKVTPMITFPAPGERKEQVEIRYTSEKGLKGVVVLDKDKSSSADIAAAIKKHGEDLDKIIGSSIEIK